MARAMKAFNLSSHIASFLLYFLIILTHSGPIASYRCFLHIGPHKTGSTEIQAFLTANGKALQQLGYRVIGHHTKEAAAAFAYGLHLHLHGGTHESLNQALVWERTLVDIASCDSDIVLSSEVFSSINATQIDVLAKLLECYNTSVIAFHRSHLHYVKSYWSQSSKDATMPVSLTDFVLKDILGHLDPQPLHETLKMYESVFGINSIKVLSFEGVLELDTVAVKSTSTTLPAPVPSFLRVIGVDPETPSNKKHTATTATAPTSATISSQWNPVETFNTSPQSEMIYIYQQLRTFGFMNNLEMRDRGRAMYQINVVEKKCKDLPLITTTLTPPQLYVSWDLAVGQQFNYIVHPPSNSIFEEPITFKTLCVTCLPSHQKEWKECKRWFFNGTKSSYSSTA